MQYHHHTKPGPSHPAGDSGKPRLRVDFDGRFKLEFHGSKIVRHGSYVTFQIAEVAIQPELFAEILRRIGGMRAAPMPP